MSHRPERKEKNCLNCGTTVQGRYCQVCGQENTEPKESFAGMVLHFFYDITHFDGKFFSTLKVMFRKPGFLTEEYVKGRRASYLNPIRMYVFTSAFFFLIFFTFFGISKKDIADMSAGAQQEKWPADTAVFFKNAHTPADTALIRSAISLLLPDSLRQGKDSLEEENTLQFSLNNDIGRFHSAGEYDAVQDSLPPAKRDGWLTRVLSRKIITLNTQYKGRSNELGAQILDRFLHMMPYLLFVSLPLYALFLQLLHIRRRNRYFYADHGLFLIHQYIFTFLVLLLFFLCMRLNEETGYGIFTLLQTALGIYGVVYALLAMKRFYKQGWPKTIAKFILFNMLCLICISILFILFLGLTVYTT